MLHTLTVENFRCIARAELEFSPFFNLIHGDNASGKTTLLEAVYYLGRARSFRTAKLEPLIRDGSESLGVAGRVGERRQMLGIQRGRRSGTMRLAGEQVRSLSELAQAFPVQALDPTVHGLLEDGPRQRRRFVDWGVFHVEPGFQAVWQRYNRALRQRNVLLRQGAPRNEFLPWEQELAEAGKILDQRRRAYLARLQPALLPVTANLLALEAPITLDYQQGWPADETLAAALERGWKQDMTQGATRSGPHRADFVIRIDGKRAQDRVSRGQQKVLAGSLVLSQMRDFHAMTGAQAVMLADDLTAELDAAHLARFLEVAGDGSSQLFLTAIRPDSVPGALREQGRVFHVERGVLTQNKT